MKISRLTFAVAILISAMSSSAVLADTWSISVSPNHNGGYSASLINSESSGKNETVGSNYRTKKEARKAAKAAKKAKAGKASGVMADPNCGDNGRPHC